jgi:hypothetical protein
MRFLLLSLLLSPQDSPIEKTARAVAGWIADEPGGFEPLLHESFLRQIPAARLAGILQDLHRKNGRVASATLQSRDSETSGVFSFAFEKGARMRVTITVTAGDPPRIIGLWFAPSGGGHASMDEVLAEMKKLPGTVSFRLARLGVKIEPLHDLNPDASLAIGSTFKLYILAALLEDRRPWDEVLRLKPEFMSLPSGELQTWPEGAPITVHTLAALMISKSDNTATDHLLRHAGRERVEQLMEPLGNARPERSRPFLSTMEMFKLKGNPALMKKYLEAGEPERRGMLEGPVREVPRSKVSGYAGPVAIDRLEWFASAADLCRLMDWYRRKDDPSSFRILGINRGLDVPEGRFPLACYKGGSEPGVLNLTWLLRSADGTTYALSAGWNDPEKTPDEQKFFGLVQSAIHLAGR